MQIVDKFIAHARSMAISAPEIGWKELLLGFRLNKYRMRLFPDNEIAKGYQKLEASMMRFVADALSKKGSYIWGNIFAPCEIVQQFGLKMLSVECLACYLSGYHIENYLIDHAQENGIAPTLCSYHKTFIGAVESEIVPVPDYGVTTSLSCDSNLNTFRYLKKKTGTDYTFLDVPYEQDDAAEIYLAEQLYEFSKALAQRTSKTLDLAALRKTIRIENLTRRALMEFQHFLGERAYPGKMIHYMYLMMGSHLMMGTQEFFDLAQFLVKDIQKQPVFKGKRILWVHLMPFYQQSLNHYFNTNTDYQIIPGDCMLDFTEMLNEDDPFRALAHKLISNTYNGPYAVKAESIVKMARYLQPDGVIDFCHWGCKQASGGSALLKEKMKSLDIPTLILDGDGIDTRNSHDGQIRTRLEAFLELLSNEKGAK